jgi:hypothetical protein
LHANARLFSRNLASYNRACQGSVATFKRKKGEARCPATQRVDRPMDTSGNTDTVSTPIASHQDTLIIKIIERLEAQHEEMLHRLNELDPALAQRVMKEVLQPKEE